MRTQLLTLALAIAPTVAFAQQKQIPPAGGKPKHFILPAKREFTLPNGMRVTLVPFGSVPKATVNLAIRVGNVDEGPNETWLADVTGDLMNEGTVSLTSTQIAEMTAGMGGTIGVGVGADQATVGGSVLGERAAEFIRLVADVVRHPRFPESELPRIKAGRAAGRDREESAAADRDGAILPDPLRQPSLRATVSVRTVAAGLYRRADPGLSREELRRGTRTPVRRRRVRRPGRREGDSRRVRRVGERDPGRA